MDISTLLLVISHLVIAIAITAGLTLAVWGLSLIEISPEVDAPTVSQPVKVSRALPATTFQVTTVKPRRAAAGGQLTRTLARGPPIARQVFY